MPGVENSPSLLLSVKQVRKLLTKKKLKQREIAALLDIDQAEVSKLMNGQYHLFAEGGFLNRLNKKVTVKITPRRRGESPQEVVFA